MIMFARYVRELLFQYVKEHRDFCFDGDNSRANRMQSQACLSYAEVQPRLAVSFRALAIEIESGFQSLLRRQSLNSRQNYEQKKSASK